MNRLLVVFLGILLAATVVGADQGYRRFVAPTLQYEYNEGVRKNTVYHLWGVGLIAGEKRTNWMRSRIKDRLRVSYVFTMPNEAADGYQSDTAATGYELGYIQATGIYQGIEYTLRTLKFIDAEHYEENGTKITGNVIEDSIGIGSYSGGMDNLVLSCGVRYARYRSPLDRTREAMIWYIGLKTGW